MRGKTAETLGNTGDKKFISFLEGAPKDEKESYVIRKIEETLKRLNK